MLFQCVFSSLQFPRCLWKRLEWSVQILECGEENAQVTSHRKGSLYTRKPLYTQRPCTWCISAKKHIYNIIHKYIYIYIHNERVKQYDMCTHTHTHTARVAQTYFMIVRAKPAQEKQCEQDPSSQKPVACRRPCPAATSTCFLGPALLSLFLSWLLLSKIPCSVPSC